jgi:hypothetical protein
LTVALYAGEKPDSSSRSKDTSSAPASKQPSAGAAVGADASQVKGTAGASANGDSSARAAVGDKPSNRLSPKPGTESAAIDPAPVERAIRTIAECQARYQSVRDYTCILYKRERISGRMGPTHIMSMKVRTNPQSVYLKFRQPAQGREAIYIAGRNGGKLLAHDVGLNKLLAGTLELEPTSARAMEECRHPITEAGIGPLLDTLAKRWALELDPDESTIRFQSDLQVGKAHCSMIESIHPHRRPHFMYPKVRVFIDDELGLPIRFEAYDWPKRSQHEPELAEEYTYSDLRLNVGLKEIDFDVANSAYSFGRF